MSQREISEADLHASIDGQLPSAALADVDAWLREHPQDAERIAQYCRQNAALRSAYDDVLKEAVPDGMIQLAQRPPRRWWMRHAAVLAWFALGGVVGGVIGAVSGWKYHDSPSAAGVNARAAPAFVRQAAIAHAVYIPEVRHPVEVGADQEEHLVGWLSKRLNTKLRIPHLGELGYALVGGRLLPGQSDDRAPAPVAQFMYQDAKGQRLTLYVRVGTVAARETAFRFAQEKNIGVFYWVDQKLGYALSGEIDKTELMRVASAVYKQLNP